MSYLFCFPQITQMYKLIKKTPFTKGVNGVLYEGCNERLHCLFDVPNEGADADFAVTKVEFANSR